MRTTGREQKKKLDGIARQSWLKSSISANTCFEQEYWFFREDLALAFDLNGVHRSAVIRSIALKWLICLAFEQRDFFSFSSLFLQRFFVLIRKFHNFAQERHTTVGIPLSTAVPHWWRFFIKFPSQSEYARIPAPPPNMQSKIIFHREITCNACIRRAFIRIQHSNKLHSGFFFVFQMFFHVALLLLCSTRSCVGLWASFKAKLCYKYFIRNAQPNHPARNVRLLIVNTSHALRNANDAEPQTLQKISFEFSMRFVTVNCSVISFGCVCVGVCVCVCICVCTRDGPTAE